jgi:hypothetical protein
MMSPLIVLHGCCCFPLLLQELPDTVRHVVLGTTVPIVYPHLKGGEAILGTLGKLNKNGFMKKVRAARGLGCEWLPASGVRATVTRGVQWW